MEILKNETYFLYEEHGQKYNDFYVMSFNFFFLHLKTFFSFLFKKILHFNWQFHAFFECRVVRGMRRDRDEKKYINFLNCN